MAKVGPTQFRLLSRDYHVMLRLPHTLTDKTFLLQIHMGNSNEVYPICCPSSKTD